MVQASNVPPPRPVSYAAAVKKEQALGDIQMPATARITRGDSEPHVPPPILAVLASTLEQLVERTERACGHRVGDAFGLAGRPSVFHGASAPDISVPNYLERIFNYAQCSFSCFVLAYIYLDRFVEQNPYVPITSNSVHRLLITAVLLAAKFLDDVYYSNAYYAKVGGLPTAELNALELELLQRLSFRLHVTPETMEAYCLKLEAALAANEATASLAWTGLFAHSAPQGAKLVNGVGVAA